MTFRVDLPGGESRLRKAILYVCRSCEQAKRFGKVKLWRSDFTAFAERRAPVTGRAYVKLAAGPAPEEMPSMLASMEAAGLLEINRRDVGGGYIEERPRALREPNLRFFSPDDLTFIDAAIQFYWKKTASAASELSHQAAWKSRNFLDPLPYESVFLSDVKPSARQLSRFSEIAASRKTTSL